MSSRGAVYSILFPDAVLNAVVSCMSGTLGYLFYDNFVGKGVVCQNLASFGKGRRLAGGLQGSIPKDMGEFFSGFALNWLC